MVSDIEYYFHKHHYETNYKTIMISIAPERKFKDALRSKQHVSSDTCYKTKGFGVSLIHRPRFERVKHLPFFQFPHLLFVLSSDPPRGEVCLPVTLPWICLTKGVVSVLNVWTQCIFCLALCEKARGGEKNNDLV